MKPGLKTYLCMAATGLSLFSVSQVAQATCSTEPYIGSICYTAANFCPRGYMQAAGQTLTVASNQTLFSLLTNVYGGDGRTTFMLPDLRGRTPVAVGQGAGLILPVTLGQKRGTETTTLTVAQMPAHSHAATFTPTSSGPVGPAVVKATTKVGVDAVPSATNNQLSAATGPTAKIYGPAAAAGDTQIPLAGVSGGGAAMSGVVAIATNGSSQPFAIISPQLGLTACIATEGLYPMRPD